MSKTLVAYFSWTGHTRQVAEEIAAALDADVETIREVNARSGWTAYIRSIWEVLTARLVPIVAPGKDPAAYDLVVLGTPVWAGRMSSPLRAYITRQTASLSRIAVFCTEGGASGEKVVREISELCGTSPVATLVVTEPEIRSGEWRHKVAEFVKPLRLP